MTAGFTVFAVRPLWPVPVNQASGYPAQLLSQRGPGTVPVIGGEGNDALVRVDLVQRRAGQAYLTDPFSGRVLRAATAAEVKKIGSWPYALEWYGHPAGRQLVLTFDDGPDPRNTPEILAILAREHVPATFFVVGANAVRHPGLVGQEIRQGSAVGNHTLTHSGLGHASVLDREDLVGADRIIRAIADYGTRLFRIPYGDPDDNVLAVLRAQQLGYTVVDYVMLTPEVIDGDAAVLARAAGRAEELARGGFRVLAVAEDSRPDLPDSTGMERGLRLLGLTAILDPPRPAAAAAIASCQAAGITPVLITGDHPATAGAVARDLGIIGPGEEVVDCRAAGCEAAFAAARVFARATPEQKLAIVAARQAAGDVVAMTGDGVNDGPALRRADIGVAMGRRGTEVARQAADLVLADDDLGTVVAAAEEGRFLNDLLKTRPLTALDLLVVFALSTLGYAAIRLDRVIHKDGRWRPATRHRPPGPP